MGWFVIALAGLWWLIDARLVWFDSNGRLQHQASSPRFEPRLIQALKTHVADLESVVFHVRQEACRCNWRTQGHQSAISRRVAEQGGKNIVIDIDQNPALQRLIPATPAIIIFDAKEQLIYLGPYADGAFCNSQTSFVEQLIPLLTTSVNEDAHGWVNMVAKGCYCSVAI